MKLEFEQIAKWGSDRVNRIIRRAKVKNGWLVTNTYADADKVNVESMVFVPDPNHEWEVGEDK